MRVLVISGQKFRVHCEVAGCLVECAETGNEALEFTRSYEFDVVVANLRLPDMDGTKLIRCLRDRKVETPILALSPTNQVALKIAALTTGADDVVELSIDPGELIARLRAIVRRSRGYSQQVLSAGPVSLNLVTHEVTVRDKPVSLTRTEIAILELMLLRRGTPLSKDTILHHLYAGAEREPDPKIVDVFVCKIRKKLGSAGAPGMIGTAWGRGFVLHAGSEEPANPALPTSSLQGATTEPALA